MKTKTIAPVRSISHHMASVDAHNSAVPGAIPLKIGEDPSEMWPNSHAKFRVDRLRNP